jgi:hypothetical protein
LENKKKIDDINAVQQNAMKKVIATTKTEATKVAKGKTKEKKGSTKKASKKKETSKKASKKKSGSKKPTKKKSGSKKTTTKKKKGKEGFLDLGEASTYAIAKAVAAIKKALA